jgi:hypothetical protein
MSTYQLSREERITALERELYALRAGRKEVFDGVEILKRNKPTQKPETAGSQTRPNAPAQETAPQQPEDPLVHPFSNIPEGRYVPPANKNFAGAPSKKDQPAYRTSAPIHKPHIADDVYTRTMKASSIVLSPEELLSISPEVRQKIRDAVTPKRDPVAANIQEETLPPQEAAEIFAQAKHTTSSIPPAAYVAHDPYEMYLTGLRPGDIAEDLIVAEESHSLRSVMALVDNKEEVECVVDPGSQIIAMSEAVCINLGLSYDPDIVLHMQSANGTINRSLGLARNVPCRIGNITFYLQIHVIKSPAYDILLGRPFDVLTESSVQNYANEDQTITVRDPNTGFKATIPTFARGKAKHMAPAVNFRHAPKN